VNLSDKIVAIHKALTRARLPHAFGGALALAWCTQRARGTIDIDLNVFITTAETDLLVGALPKWVVWRHADLLAINRDGQVRLWCDETPLDLFLNTTEIHAGLAQRIRWEKFAGQTIPFLSCTDLAIFKAFFNRTKDWADLEEMQLAGTLESDRVRTVITRHLGADDKRIERLRSIASNKF
jgi:hypothetical protein